MSDYQGRQVDEQPHGHTPSFPSELRKARGDRKCKMYNYLDRVQVIINGTITLCKKRRQ